MNHKSKNIICLLFGVSLAVATILPLGEAIYSARIVFDPALGRVFWPGKTVVWRLEGSGRSLWSEYHVRRERLPTAKERPVVLVLGDSMTQALQVDDQDVYTKRLEDSLRASGVPAAVLNAGVGNRSMADYVAWAKLYQGLFSPDWVVVEVTWCDFQEALEATRPAHFRRNVTNECLEVVAPPPPSRPGRAFRAFASLPDVLADRLTFAYPAYRAREFTKWVRNEPPWFHAPAPRPAEENGVQNLGFPEARRPQSADLAGTNGSLLISKELDLLKKTWHGRITLLLLTSYNPLGAPELRPDEMEIDALARKKGLSIVRLDEGFGRLPPGVSPYGFNNLGGYNTGHMNPRGHQLAADLLAAELKRIASANDLF